MPENDLVGALAAWGKVLGREAVLSDSTSLEKYARNVSGFQRRVPAVLCPDSTAQVQAIVEIANQFRTPLYPISCGKNWGLGSSLPVMDGCVIVDLSRMNWIRELSVEQHLAVVEPGVTQGQLYERIADDKLPLLLNVTGSGMDTSLIGNALERGVGYFASRADSLIGLEVVLGSGRIVHTGFGHFPNAKNTYVYRHGVGPELDGLFFQSNFGIVTGAAISLMPAAPCQLAMVATLAREEDFERFIEAMAALFKGGIIHTAVHIANRARTEISLGPMIYLELAKRKTSGPEQLRAEAIELIHKEGFGAWSAAGGLMGTRAQVKVACREIKRRLSGIAKVRFVTDGLIKTGQIVSHALSFIPWFARQEILANAVEPIYGLSKGIPSDLSLNSVSWPVGGVPSPNPKDPDFGSAGLLYSLPMIPMSGKAARETADRANRVFGKHGFVAYITMNIVEGRALECVINLAYNRHDAGRQEQAEEAISELNAEYLTAGLIPYRTTISLMNQLVNPNDPFWRTVRDLKDALDPNHIISPGRYNLV